MRILPIIAGVAALGIVSAPMMAEAGPTTESFTLGASNLGGGFPPPYGTVAVNLLSSTTAQLTYESNLAGGYIFVDGGAAAANFNGPVTLSLVSCNAPSLSCGSDGGSGHEDGFGDFSNSWNLANAGAGNRASEIVLTATLTRGSWDTDVGNVLTANNNIYVVAAHIGSGDCTTLATCNSIDLTKTGFAGNGSVVPAPEPLSLALLGTGLVGLGFAQRRRKNQA